MELNEKERTALDEFKKNPHWNEYFETAPSDKCKYFIAMEFCNSEYNMDMEYSNKMKQVETELSADDLKHLLKYCPKNPRRPYLKKKIAELENGNA